MPFTDPIVAGTVLIREAIRSPNYVPGVSGWTINRDGSVEFMNGTFRGEVRVTDPDGSYIRIYDENPGAGTIIEFGPATTTYPNPVDPGQIFFTTFGDPTTFDSQLFITPAHPTGFAAPSLGLFVIENGVDYITQVAIDNGQGTSIVVGSITPGSAPNIEVTSPWTNHSGVFYAQNLPETGVSFTPTITGGGAFSLGTAVPLGMEWRQGNMAHVKIQLTWTNGNQGTGGWSIGGFSSMVAGALTQSAIVGRWWYVKPASASRASGDILMNSGSPTVACQVGGGLPTLGGFTQLGQNLPEAWLAGSILTMEFSFPVA